MALLSYYHDDFLTIYFNENVNNIFPPFISDFNFENHLPKLLPKVNIVLLGMNTKSSISVSERQ